MRSLQEIENGIIPFLDKLENEIANTGIDMSSAPADHICFRVETAEEYTHYLSEFSKLGKLIREAPINGRNIAVFELFKAIEYKKYSINCLELPEPKTGSPYKTGWQHIECVIDEDFDTFMKFYHKVAFDTSAINNKPNPEIAVIFPDKSAVKFHRLALLKIIEMEENGLV